jgi:Ca-activated chloride channel homolog
MPHLSRGISLQRLFWLAASTSLFAFLAAILIMGRPVYATSAPPIDPPKVNQMAMNSVYLKLHRVTATINDQLAVTKVEQVFVNEGTIAAEGEYLFPLPEGAAVSDLVMYIDGQPVRGNILSAQEAERIYTEIVRSQRDPALLRYVGRSAIQLNVFPIPPRSERKVEITYSHIPPAESGVINYAYLLRADYATRQPIRQVSASLEVTSSTPISTIYSPNPLIGISRQGDTRFRAGFEATNFRADEDFSIFYAAASNEIDANLITYRPSANEDGFFLLLVTPPTKSDTTRIIPKDVTIVMDQSGSMFGEKFRQAQDAAIYVLKNLNPEDRFNVIAFSTGYRIFAQTPQALDAVADASQWINRLEATGGTDINIALETALDAADTDRQTVILFLTDGLPTEGITTPNVIVENVKKRANNKTRIFSFGVGDDVDTVLLDTLSSNYGGTSSYVRPAENIEQKVSALYNKIASPVLTNLKIDFSGVILEDFYPGLPLPDLFAGSQLVIAGRYRGDGIATITLTGDLQDQPQTYTYTDLRFSANAGGEPFVARLWAQRKIGALLNSIRLNGESKELVDAVVTLSVRYGIITPYTSYLIVESDIPGRRDGNGNIVPPPLAPQPTFAPMFSGTTTASRSGSEAVDKAQESGGLASGDALAALPTAAFTTTPLGTSVPGGAPAQPAPVGVGGQSGSLVVQVKDRAFVKRGTVWVDTLYTDDKMPLQQITFLSDAYFELLKNHPEIAAFLAVGDHMILVIDGVAYEIKP